MTHAPPQQFTAVPVEHSLLELHDPASVFELPEEAHAVVAVVVDDGQFLHDVEAASFW